MMVASLLPGGLKVRQVRRQVKPRTNGQQESARTSMADAVFFLNSAFARLHSDCNMNSLNCTRSINVHRSARSHTNATSNLSLHVLWYMRETPVTRFGSCPLSGHITIDRGSVPLWETAVLIPSANDAFW